MIERSLVRPPAWAIFSTLRQGESLTLLLGLDSCRLLYVGVGHCAPVWDAASALEDSMSQVWFDTTGPVTEIIITNSAKRSEIVCDD